MIANKKFDKTMESPRRLAYRKGLLASMIELGLPKNFIERQRRIVRKLESVIEKATATAK